MIQLLSPTLVTELPPAFVPRFMVQYSRIVFPAPIINLQSSPSYFLSWGISEIEAN